ncbi:MAG: hypothetical protein JXR96_25170 [Deltaproteobacteria bacterium]|nr:hypothetical protein [Deltaproteobacteria bacterium]
MIQRPTSVTVFAVLNIVFGSLGLLGFLFNLLAQSAVGDLTEVISSHPFLGPWQTVTTVLSGVVSAGLLTIGIGMLSLRPWARTGCIVYGVYGILSSLVAIVVTFVVLKPMLTSMAPELGSGMGSGVGSMVVTTAVASAVIGGLLGMLYPALLWYFMTRPKVKKAFDPQEQRLAEAFE